MRKVSIILCILLIGSYSQSQEVNFIREAKIEFERKTNTHRLYFSGENDGGWMEQMKKMIPQFRVDYFDLLLDGNKALYRPGKENDQKNVGFFESPATNNVIFSDLTQQTVTSQKQVFETLFLLQDSAKKYSWKMEPETRTIAGYECRKAITRICDSVVVVAFFTEEIVPSVGPESFNGLPGTILGLAVPRLYTTWFATKVEVLSEKDKKALAAPAKGKKATGDDMVKTVDNAIKDWGNQYHDRAIWFLSL